MILSSDDFMDQVYMMRDAGIRRGEESAIIEYGINGTTFTVFHIIPQQLPSERRHIYGSHCWCSPDTDGFSFMHMRAH